MRDRDQREHQREAAVDRVDEVGCWRPARRRRGRPAPVAWAASRTPVSVSPPASVPLSGLGIASTIAVPPRRQLGAARARTRRGCRRRRRSAAATFCRVGPAVDEDLVREQRALADPGALERLEPGLGARPTSRSSRRRRSPSCSRTRRRERDDHQQPGARRRPAAARHGLGPARPGAARLVVGALVRPVEPRPERRQHDRQQRDRDGGRDERDQHPAVAHRAQERHRQREQREQPDGDGEAAEHDGAAGGLHRPLHGLVARVAVRALLAPARDHQQRVVDRHAQPDQRDQELHDRRDGGQLGEPEQQHEAGHDRHDGHHQRDDRQRRGEHEQQHDAARRARRSPPRRARRARRCCRRSPRRARRSR